MTPGWKFYIVLGKMLARRMKLAGHSRQAVTRDSRSRILQYSDTGGPVAPHLCHREPDQGLNAGQEDVS